jgi:hypothetical protein
VVSVYLSREAARGLSPSAITVALAAMGWAHKRGGCPAIG